jgi:rare lipoprotein A
MRMAKPIPTWQRLAQRSVVACAALALAACGTLSGRTSSKDAQVSSRSGGDQVRKRGGYYLDDGPGDNAPADLDAIPDAVPRFEPLQRSTSRPYTALGRSYTPMTELAPYRARGMATWYGRRYHGQRTSSGEVYDMYAMTAAHTTLPIPSYARVTNVDNGRSVIVRINDRGPFIDERLIDLSYVAAYKLDLVRTGSGRVEVETVLPADLPQTATAARRAPALAATAGGETESAAAAPLPTEPPAPAATAPAAAPVLASAAGHYLQLGAFSVQDNAQRFMERLQTQLGGEGTALSMTGANSLYRVRSGPYASRAEALQAAERIGQILGATPILASPR